MAYLREGEASPPVLYGYWTPDKGAIVIRKSEGRKYIDQIPAAGFATFLQAAALLRRNGKPISRIAIYQWAKEGKIRYQKTRPRPKVRSVAVIRLSQLRKFAEDNGFECLPYSAAPPSER